jgi:ABC-type polar amino acid transport system ATPase subunit
LNSRKADHSGGDITIDTGKSISQQKGLIRRLRQHVGFVFQNFNLFPHRTVLENIIEGPVIVKVSLKRKRRRVRANCWLKSGWRVKRPAIRAVCLAGSSSAWRLRARWRCALT